MHAEVIKKEISKWLLENLYATLSEGVGEATPQKTVITDIRKNSAHFLGFEIYAYRHSQLKYVLRGTQVRDNTTNKKITVYKRVLSKVAGQQIASTPPKTPAKQPPLGGGQVGSQTKYFFDLLL
jgi:hypothetical protein